MANYYASKTYEISEREQNHMNIVRKIAGECMTLLENDGTLPFHELGKIALYGNGARHTVKGGTGSGDVNSRKTVTIEEGLTETGFVITTENWLKRYDNMLEQGWKDYRKEVEERAKEKGVPEFSVYFEYPFPEPPVPQITKEDVEISDTQTAVYVIARNSGEGADRYYKEGDYLLMKEELNNIQFLAENYEKTIVILNVANVIDTTELKAVTGINAILLAGQAGNIGGYAVADVLLGKTIPSGKLADTWAKKYTDYLSSENFSHNNGNLDDEYYTDGIYVGYRYFDTFNVTPNYCFGYGKSYTEFSIKPLAVTANEEKIHIDVLVTNIGKKYNGKEVVQVYYSAPEGSLEKPYQELAAFGKTDTLVPGESQKLEISFPTSAMASYSEKKAAWILEAGTYYIRVGNSSRNTSIVAAIVINEEVKTVQLKNLFSGSEDLKEISKKDVTPYGYDTEEQEKNNAQILKIDSKKFICEYVNYQGEPDEFAPYREKFLTLEDIKNGKASLKDLISQLTVKEMATVCNGAAQEGVSGGTFVGSASDAAPGAAGDTTSILLEKRKIQNIILADGPAGLRLTPHFVVDSAGQLVPGYEVFGNVPMQEKKEKPEGARDYYQYCTAIPVASLLAQSWDMELIEKCGDIIGKEMEEFHITLWLAPGMNIHRNPLCGRNFEYYSEDPLLSGMCAAADTKGVQSHAGIGTTIKHFAANNQEDNRMFTNAHISERAIREIYLKGFEIAVKTSQPMSIMTSYNLLNGIHTANNHDLLMAAARDEWKFAGVIMTDWGTSEDLSKIFGMSSQLKYTHSAPEVCVAAGNDLQMPGCKKNIQAIIDGVKNGKITLAQLQMCTWRILNIVEQSLAYGDCKPYGEQFKELDWAVEVVRY